MTTAGLLARGAAVRAGRRIELGRLLLTLLALLPVAIGAAAGAVVTVVVWFASFVVVGWEIGRGRSGEGSPG